LAGLAALITLWLGSLAQFSGERAAAAVRPPDQLAVVQVQAGETLQQLAERVAPGASAVEVAERIRDLNKLHSAAVDAGQTLIAPVGLAVAG
jgi:predicted Zn-dependent protease